MGMQISNLCSFYQVTENRKHLVSIQQPIIHRKTVLSVKYLDLLRNTL